MATKTKTTPIWEIKDRTYYLLNGKPHLHIQLKVKTYFGSITKKDMKEN
jgi:hypothetical protein